MTDQKLRDAAEKYGTPSYLFDEDAFIARCHWIRKELGSRVRICYAMKANPFFVPAADKAADSLEVCSPGEFAICERAGIKPEKIVLSGVNKAVEDLLPLVAKRGAHTYTAESLQQVELIEQCAAKAGAERLSVLLRLTSGNQFGMEESLIFSLIARRAEYPHLDFRGIQYYSGTQKKKPDKIWKELQILDQICTRLQDELGVVMEELEYGPGFSIPYFEPVSEKQETELLRQVRDALNRMTFSGAVTLELGRFLAAPCGDYLTRIVDTKVNHGQNYCIVDGGIHHVNYYGQTMAMKLPPYRFLPDVSDCEREEGAEELWTVCGSLCTAGDVIVRNLPLKEAKQGDLLVFERIGAYSVTEGIYLFLSRKLPRILMDSAENGLTVVREAIPTDRLNFWPEQEGKGEEKWKSY